MAHRQELTVLAKRYGVQATEEFLKTIEVWEEPTDAEGNLIVLSSNEAIKQFLSSHISLTPRFPEAR